MIGIYDTYHIKLKIPTNKQTRNKIKLKEKVVNNIHDN